MREERGCREIDGETVSREKWMQKERERGVDGERRKEREGAAKEKRRKTA